MTKIQNCKNIVLLAYPVCLRDQLPLQVKNICSFFCIVIYAYGSEKIAMFQIDLNSMFISTLIMNFTIIFGCDEIQGYYNVHPKQIIF